MEECMFGLAQITTDEQWVTVTNVIWAIWRCRNDMRYKGKKLKIETFCRYLISVQAEAEVVKTSNTKQVVQEGSGEELNGIDYQQGYTCQVDGSWIQNWTAGIGFLLTWGDALVAYRSAGVRRACCAVQAEAQALKEALNYVRNCGIEGCIFYTDCNTLVTCCTVIQPPLEADWRAYKEMYEIWVILKQTGYVCRYRSRHQNTEADSLARRGSRTGLDYMGFTLPMFPPV